MPAETARAGRGAAPAPRVELAVARVAAAPRTPVAEPPELPPHHEPHPWPARPAAARPADGLSSAEVQRVSDQVMAVIEQRARTWRERTGRV